MMVGWQKGHLASKKQCHLSSSILCSNKKENQAGTDWSIHWEL